MAFCPIYKLVGANASYSPVTFGAWSIACIKSNSVVVAITTVGYGNIVCVFLHQSFVAGFSVVRTAQYFAIVEKAFVTCNNRPEVIALTWKSDVLCSVKTHTVNAQTL